MIYRHGDQVDSAIYTTVNGSGKTRDYTAFGDQRPRSQFQALDTAYTYGGQYEDGTGLVYMNARYYDPNIGMFISPDTIIPDPSNVLDYNRYLYARGNPLKYNDPTGHCPICIWAILAGAAFLLEGSVAETPAGNYTDVPDNANGLLGVGLITAGAGGMLGNALIGPMAAPGTSIATQATQAACADGDCTSEVRTITNSGQSVWQLDQFARGWRIEELLGRSARLAHNNPVIDDFVDGTAVSIKSVDTTTKSYQSVSALTTEVNKYLTSLTNYQGGTWAGVTIQPHEIQRRVLQLAIPPGTTLEQWEALRQIQQTVGTTMSNTRIELIIVH